MHKTYSILLLLLAFRLYAQSVPNDSLTLIFVGDIMSHGPQLRAAKQPNGQFNYDENFFYIQAYFKSADFVLANLETTLGVKPYHGYPQFSAPAALATACQRAGINVLCTANNHSCDKGRKGITKTIEILDSLNISHTGTFKNGQDKAQKNPLILKKNNRRIMVLNYTYGTNGLPVPSPAKVNIINKVKIKNDLKKARSLKPDLLLVFLHWGEQYQNHPNKRQKDLVNFLHQNGVHYIIGAHPHVIQDVTYNKINGNFTAFSLGNFISNQRSFPRDGSIMLELTFVPNAADKLVIKNIKVHPLWVYKFKKASKWHFQILPVEQFKFKPSYFTRNEDYQKMMHYYKHFNSYHFENLTKIKP